MPPIARIARRPPPRLAAAPPVPPSPVQSVERAGGWLPFPDACPPERLLALHRGSEIRSELRSNPVPFVRGSLPLLDLWKRALSSPASPPVVPAILELATRRRKSRPEVLRARSPAARWFLPGWRESPRPGVLPRPERAPLSTGNDSEAYRYRCQQLPQHPAFGVPPAPSGRSDDTRSQSTACFALGYSIVASCLSRSSD